MDPGPEDCRKRCGQKRQSQRAKDPDPEAPWTQAAADAICYKAMPDFLFPRFGSLLQGLVARLFPPTCILCGAPGQFGLDLCAGCFEDLPFNRHACPRCARPLLGDLPPGISCGVCQRRPPPYATCRTAFVYQEPVSSLILRAKFSSRLNMARLLGVCLARTLFEQGVDLPEQILPVPLHPQRLRQRGYNQALEIARATAAELGLAVETRSCVRGGSVIPQMGLNRAQRQRNLRGAFTVARPLKVRHVALVDDVVTTGSTGAEAARALLDAGVARVDLWAVARTDHY